jgi:hypothetical protein
MSTPAAPVPAPVTASQSRGRSMAAGVVGLIAVLAILLASVVGTMHAVVLSPDTLTSVLAPVGANPQVQAVVANKAAAKIVTELDVEGRAQKVLPGPLGPLMAPTIAQTVQDRIASTIEDAMGTPAFANSWDRMVHAFAVVAVNVLRGDSAAITTSDGVVYLNMLPALAGTLDALKTQGLIDASVQLPDLSDPTTPAQQAIARLGSALGVSLPSDFGQVALAQTNGLATAQGAIAAFDTATLILIIAAILLTIIAVALAANRRAMVIKIGIAAALLVAVLPPLLRLADHSISSGLASPGTSIVAGAFIDAIVDAISWPLRVVAAVCLAAAFGGMLAGAVTGAAANRPAAVLPMLIGAAAFLVVWVVVGPDAALLTLGLVAAGAWITGRQLLVQAPA